MKLDYRDTIALELKRDDVIEHQHVLWRVLGNDPGKVRVTPGEQSRAVTAVAINTGKISILHKAAKALIPKLVTPGRVLPWKPQPGDVVLFQPGEEYARWSVAVRGPDHWSDSALPRLAMPDSRVQHAVRYREARVLKAGTDLEPTNPSTLWWSGTVIGSRSLTTKTPIAWLRVENDRWMGTTGVEASDIMIRQGWRRKSYRLLHTEEPRASWARSRTS